MLKQKIKEVCKIFWLSFIGCLMDMENRIKMRIANKDTYKQTTSYSFSSSHLHLANTIKIKSEHYLTFK